MAKYIYTCFVCGFPFVAEEEEMPTNCPGCGARPENYLKEPWTGSIETRRIHVDPPAVDENRDPYDISFHMAHDFDAFKGNGMVRRWVMDYDDAEVSKKFYEDVFGWDIVKTNGSDDKNPTLFCATGPGTDDWQPNVPSFTYGYLKKRNPQVKKSSCASFIVEVKDLGDTIKKIVEYGGKLIVPAYVEEGEAYALIEDCEGNTLYLWEVKGEKFGDCGVNPERSPKKFTKKSLHGRTRFLSFSYKDFRRFQKFYIDIFGWDMIECPEAACGIKPGSETPCVVATCGPAQPDYEATESGYMNSMVHHTIRTDGSVDPIGFVTEIEMDVPLEEMIKRIIDHGGKLVEDKKISYWAVKDPKDGVQTWIMSAVVEDPAGNLLLLWKCPPSRTWEEPETGYDGENGIIYG